MTTHETQEFTKEVLNHMRDRLSDYQEMYGDLYNLEASPAESTSYRLAKHDVARYPDIVTAAQDGGTPYYTNSSHLPVSYTEDIFSALDIQDELQTLYTSGTVFHAFVGEKLPSWQAAAALVRKISENYKLPYYTLSPTYSICKNHGYLIGEQYRCPLCGEVTEVYSRITGYYRPVQNWNAGKTQEYKERKVYNIEGSVLKPKSNKEPRISVQEEDVCAQKDAVILFSTKTCPNCKVAASLLDRAGIEYKKSYAEDEPQLAKEFGIKQAPTLTIVCNGEVAKHTGVSDIKKYIEATVRV
jgi:ribonucleoside-triphosphate reductase